MLGNLSHAQVVSCIQPEGVAAPVVAGLRPQDVTQAVLGQFRVAEVTQAMGFLQRQGVLNLVGVKRALGLTSAFHSSMQVRQQPTALRLHTTACVALSGAFKKSAFSVLLSTACTAACQ